MLRKKVSNNDKKKMGIQILIPLCFWNFWADAEANFDI